MDFVLSNAKLGFPGGSVVKNPPATTEDEVDTGSIPGLGRSPGRENDSSSQYSCLENADGQRSLAGCSPWIEEPGGLQPMDRGAWRAAAHGQRSLVGCSLWIEEPGGLQAMDRGAWWAAGHGVAKSRTRPSTHSMMPN